VEVFKSWILTLQIQNIFIGHICSVLLVYHSLLVVFFEHPTCLSLRSLPAYSLFLNHNFYLILFSRHSSATDTERIILPVTHKFRESQNILLPRSRFSWCVTNWTSSLLRRSFWFRNSLNLPRATNDIYRLNWCLSVQIKAFSCRFLLFESGRFA
jgi:hypothetical protein